MIEGFSRRTAGSLNRTVFVGVTALVSVEERADSTELACILFLYWDAVLVSV